jgi:hypothetical protein
VVVLVGVVVLGFGLLVLGLLGLVVVVVLLVGHAIIVDQVVRPPSPSPRAPR